MCRGSSQSEGTCGGPPSPALTSAIAAHGKPVECVYHGATLIADGFEYFPDWSASMLREFDDSIEPELESYYQIAKTAAGQPQERWPAIIRKELEASQADLGE